MTTLEKVAKAMYESREAKVTVATVPWGEQPRYVQGQWLALARVAVELLRNPTPDMLIAGGIAIAESMKTAETQVDNANECWRRMIGTILDENDDE